MSKMKVLVLVPIGGLANRFYAISSAISFCQMYGIRLHVIWFKDWGMGADFHSLLDLAPILSNIKVVDGKIIFMIGLGREIFGSLIYIKKLLSRKDFMKKIFITGFRWRAC